MRAGLLRRSAGTLALAALLGLAPALAQEPGPRSAAELMDVLMWNREPVGGPFALTDHTGQLRTEGDFSGKLKLVYFGFSYCPDVCPTDLQAIATAIDKLGPKGEEVQPLFITLDPERDRPAHLAEYVGLFHPRLVGLTGDEGAIRQAASAFKVYYEKVPAREGDYTLDHSGFVYLMDRDGSYLGFFPPGTSAERMIEIIRPRLSAGTAR
jgi:cytochrome oxidase Cu insertion factor (SCO1/SenC/PrrC family)